MHAMYLFLVSDGDLLGGGVDRWEEWEKLVTRRIEDYGDINNWYTLLGGVHYDGEKHVYDNQRPHSLEGKMGTFGDALVFAMRCLASDVQLDGTSSFSFPGQEDTEVEKRLDSLTYEEYKTEIISKVFAVLSWEYSKISQETWEQIKGRERFESGRGGIGMYTLEKMGECVNYFLNCVVPPFTQSRCTFYDYRCFDVRTDDWDSTDLTNCAILYADIHT